MNSKVMLKAFWQQAQLAARTVQPDPELWIGPEFEFFLHKGWNGPLATDSEKSQLLGLLGPDYGVELGACVAEYHPAPVALRTTTFGQWYEQLRLAEERLRSIAAEHQLQVGRYGTIPWAETTHFPRTDAPRYHLVPDFHKVHRPWWYQPWFEGIDITDPGIVGLLNSFQFSVQATDLTDAVDKLNRLFYLSPLATALGVNAAIIGNRQTSWQDVRMEVWKRSHDTRSLWERLLGKALRIGLPNRYFRNIVDYFRDVSSYPFILDNPEAALKIGIGLYWRDARIKFFGSKVVVEFRPLSLQPTLFKDIALAVFTFGRLLWSQSHHEILPSMKTVRYNKHQAEKLGLQAVFQTANGKKPLRTFINDEIDRAQEALSQAQLLDDFACQALSSLRVPR